MDMNVAETSEFEFSDSLRERIDQLGAMEAEVTKAKAIVATYTALQSAVKSEIEEVVPDSMTGMVIDGTTHSIDLGDRSQQSTVINMTKVIELLGVTLFMQLCKVGITDLKKYVPEHRLGEVLRTDRTGPRTFKVRKRSA